MNDNVTSTPKVEKIEAASRREKKMICVCCYKGCGVVYGEKEPLVDKQLTHGLCPEHLKISLKEIKGEMKKISMVNRRM